MHTRNICQIAQKAGENIIPFWKNIKDIQIQRKDDLSPYTQADKLAHEIISEKLSKISNNIPILSEEGKHAPYESRKDWELFWCIDPLDGTKEFIAGEKDWTINIALIHKNTPILGVVYSPLLDLMYCAKLSEGAFVNGKKMTAKSSHKTYKIAISRSHPSQETAHFIEHLPYPDKEIVKLGSSLKICYVAQGLINCYPRLSPTMEWDTAASDIIAKESGATILEWQSKTPLIYNKKSLINPPFVVANSKEIFYKEKNESRSF